jgi:hypothetical protein
MKTPRALFCLLFFGAAALILSGCTTDNPDDLSTVPWNQPAGWEGPLPSTINPGR